QTSTPSTRNFHRQLLEKALESLDHDPIEKRDFSSITLPMSASQIPYAKERIRQFRRELAAELGQKTNPKEVYNLTVQIYPVSKDE
ncbi:MAG: TIGR02147 family protein, partial [Bdellovibrionota bacterium]